MVQRARKQRESKQISVGDIVSVQDEKRPRGFWRLVRVEMILGGSNGQVGSTLV